MGKKAVSAMVAVVLLVAFTAAAAGVMTRWGTGLLGSTAESVESGTEYKVKCSNVLLQLKNIKYYGDTRNGLVGYWKFDEGSGDTATDSSGYGNDGTLTNFDFNETSGWTSDCKYGSCLRFDGVNDYMDVGNHTSLNTPDAITVAYWEHGNSVIHTSGRVGKKEVFDISRRQMGGMYFHVYVDGGYRGDYITSGVPSGVWSHVVMTYDSSTREILGFVNGVELFTYTLSNLTTYELNINTEPVEIARRGYRGYTTYFNGTIDEVRIYNRALTAGEVLDEYHYQSFVRGLLLHTGGAEGVNNVTLTAAGGGHVNTTSAFTDSTFGPAASIHLR